MRCSDLRKQFILNPYGKLDEYYSQKRECLGDVYHLIMPSVPFLEEDIREKVDNYRINLTMLKHERILQEKMELVDICPDARDVDMIIAFEETDYDIEQVVCSFKEQRFLTKTQKMAKIRGFPSRIELTVNKQRMKKKPVRSRQVKEAFPPTFESEDSLLPSSTRIRSTINCQKLIRKIADLDNSMSSASSPQVDDPPEKKDVSSITFLYNSSSFTVGERDMSIGYQNPIPGHIDLITERPMNMPAIGPDMYVFDYETWHALFLDSRCNPFTSTRVKAMSEIILLTTDNFERYRRRILNLQATVAYKHGQQPSV